MEFKIRDEENTTITYDLNQMLLSEQQSTRFRAAHFACLKQLAMFGLVVEAGSFSVAAARLGIGKSSVSRQISELEAFLGARLLNRSTRALSLTDEGRLILPECTALLALTTDAFDKLDGDLPLSGTLRIASTVEHGQYVLPSIVAEYTSRYPEIEVDLVLGDAFIDLVDRGVDLAIRVGSPGPSPHYISKKIAELEYRLFAHRDMDLTEFKRPEDCERHSWLLNAGATGDRGNWTFKNEGETVSVKSGARVVSNAFNARIEIAKCGGHLIGIPSFVPDVFFTPELVRILPDWRIVPSYPIFAVYPDARFLSPKVAEFVSLLAERHP